MKATSIPGHEHTFRQNGIDSNGKPFALKAVTVEIPGDIQSLSLIDCPRANGDASFYYKDVQPKNKIVLHFTAGFLKGDITTLTRPDYHVSVPFVIARSGDIYNLWNSRYWCYHLGQEAVGGNEAMSQHSIAIEVSNIGYLRRLGDKLVSIYSDADVYCTMADTALYTELPQTFRGHRYFATFTAAQYSSLIRLLRFLTHKYTIPRTFLPPAQRYTTLTAAQVQPYTGILSHVNFRPSGKWDFGPAFDWDLLIQGVTALAG